MTLVKENDLPGKYDISSPPVGQISTHYFNANEYRRIIKF